MLAANCAASTLPWVAPPHPGAPGIGYLASSAGRVPNRPSTASTEYTDTDALIGLATISSETVGLDQIEQVRPDLRDRASVGDDSRAQLAGRANSFRSDSSFKDTVYREQVSEEATQHLRSLWLHQLVSTESEHLVSAKP